jgi:hypothetical protein
LVGEGFTYSSEASILADTADSAASFSETSAGIEPVYKNFSVFGDDSWKVSPRVSLSVGLRWDINPAPRNGRGPSPYTVDQITNLATTKLAPQGTPLWKTDWRGFAPRFGIAYQLRQTPGRETVLRGGFGVFYDMGNTIGSQGFGGLGLSSTVYYTGVSFPLTSQQLTLPPPNISPPYSQPIYAFDPNLRLPYTLQWNVALEQLLGQNNAITIGYVGSSGRSLLAQFQYAPEAFGNPNFDVNACYGGCLLVTTNRASSNYESLQASFQRHLARGLQVLASYTWSHSIDSYSSNVITVTSPGLERGNSDFDIRHNVQAALTYDVPGIYSNPLASRILKHWGFDARMSIRSGAPVDVIGSAVFDPLTGLYTQYHPDAVPGQPRYLHASWVPGGKALNYYAYKAEPDGIEGNAGRNSGRGLANWQLNLAMRREFPLHENLHLQFRAEAFNVFNHPNFSGISSFLPAGPCTGPPPSGQSLYCFGSASQTLNSSLGEQNPLYQLGGPRSLQLALKLIF